jgi:hypothetical protein
MPTGNGAFVARIYSEADASGFDALVNVIMLLV